MQKNFTEDNSKMIEIFTDGACSGNPGPGGWGVLIRSGMTEKTFSGAELHTTNNRMELMAVIQGLALLNRECHVKVVTDSQYVCKGIAEWMSNWKKNGWMTAQRKPVKNVDLWQRLDQEVARHTVIWSWVRGHTGHRENELADALARAAIVTLLG